MSVEDSVTAASVRKLADARETISQAGLYDDIQCELIVNLAMHWSTTTNPHEEVKLRIRLQEAAQELYLHRS